MGSVTSFSMTLAVNSQHDLNPELNAILALDLSIPEHPDLPEISHSLAESVLFGGKRLRPMVTFLAGRFFGLDADAARPFARAAELTHAATLCHDDVVDAAQVRRNRPTMNRLVGNARSVLAGDILLSRVVREIVEEGHLEVLAHLAQTLEDLSAGEWLQLNYRHRVDASRATLERISYLKTGALLGWCLATPARVVGCSESDVARAKRMGELIGLAFQMVDDTIDFDPQNEKAFAKDLREGMVNFVTLEVLESKPEMGGLIKEIWEQGDANLIPLPWGVETTEVACARVRQRVQHLISEAKEILASLPGNDAARSDLRDLLDALIERRH